MDVLTFQSTRSVATIPLSMPFFLFSLTSSFTSPILKLIGTLILKGVSLPLTRHQSTQLALSAIDDADVVVDVKSSGGTGGGSVDVCREEASCSAGLSEGCVG